MDVDGNDDLTPVDLLIAINYINSHGSGPPAEGQAEGESAAMDSSRALRAASLSSLGPHPIRTSPTSPGAETERDADEPAATLQGRSIDGREDKDAVFRRVDSWNRSDLDDALDIIASDIDPILSMCPFR